MSRRLRSAFVDSLIRWSVIPLVVLTTLYGVVSYSFEARARQVVDWPAIDTYFRRDFSGAGFAIDCNFDDPQPACTMTWKPPFDSGAAPIEVYECDDEADQPREAILLRFADAVRTTLDDQTRGHALAVLNAFFESGLRQNIDDALRRAREHSNFANRLPPFELESNSRGDNWLVVGVDDTLQAIPTGLPNRPPYLGSVYASWEGARANLIQVTARSGTAQSSVWLAPGNPTPCNPLFPTGEQTGACGSVDILLCDPADPACVDEPALNVRALGPGSAIVMRAGGNAGRLLARTLDPLNVEDYVALQQSSAGRATTLYVEGVDPLPDLTVEVSHETSPPLSRLRLVNGRWTRWFEPSVEPWLVPVVSRMNRYASAEEARIDPQRTMTMTVELDLQQRLESALDEWMRTHAEPGLRAHMQAHYNSARRRLTLGPNEGGHRRPAPEAGITVLDAETGHVLAVASYPPASALVQSEGVPAFAPGWQARLAGPGAPPWAQREIVSALADRIYEDANSNFVRHPIGSTIKPLLLGSVIDSRAGDGLERLYDLVVAGHHGEQGDPRPTCANCMNRMVEAIAGLPLGPWGAELEQGQHAGDAWVDRGNFILASCNKYAVTLGVLSLLDWNGTRTRRTACCWIPPRDQFGFSAATGGAAPGNLIAAENRLPPLGRWLHPDTYETRGEFANAPIFKRLEEYYGLHAGSGKQTYDSIPWIDCAGLPGLETTVDQSEFLGRIETTALALTANRVSTAFTNIFTGGGRNWWTNVKLAEAYARVATNRNVRARFCAPPQNAPAAGEQFRDHGRWRDLTAILARQRTAAGWVLENAGNINDWVAASPGTRVTYSKTGTSLREQGFRSTGVFATYIGAIPSGALTGDPIPNGRGLVVITHIDDIGHSGNAVQLLNAVFPILERRLQ
jgi:hypothetical protein